ncbi:membrane protein [Bacteroides faecalis]|uniref:Membrane protein n=1 Tax=Bacteroides faecalis TaxID=2447885 RepID=A0A401M0F2_9BACE|nr:membrane protein [Bacteroides faecalis]
MMIKKRISLFVLTLTSLIPVSVTAKQLTLADAINIARVQSVDAAVALNELKTAYWEYRTYYADLLPEVNFSGTIPNYNKRYNSYQQDDGSYTFVRNNSLEMNGQLSIDQNIWITGGKLSLNSSLDYLKQLDGSSERSFMSVPITLTLTQPIFGINNIKWKRRIEPVRYQEAKAAFISATEEVTMKTITYFFNLLQAENNVAIARQNKENANHLYEVAQAKRKMGQISENELLQLKLKALQAKAAVTESESNLNANMFQLRAFLNLGENETIELIMPESAPNLHMEYERVLNKALENNSFALNIRRRQLEADYNVAAAKGNLRSVDLFTSVGLTGKGREFSDTYNTKHLKDNQVIEVGMRIPILDWGKRRGKVRVAESNREVIASKIKQEQMNFSQNIFLLVEHFNNQAEQLNIAWEADKIAQQRYKTSIETFLIGKINTLDLNDAQTSKDEARQKHVSELYLYWYYYYQIRSLTLYDFNSNTTLDAAFEKIIKQ